MRIAGTNVFIGLFSVSTILALLLPSEAPAFANVFQNVESGQATIVASTQLQDKPVTSSALTLTDELIPSTEVLTFDENRKLVTSMTKPEEVGREENGITYASAKELAMAEPRVEGIAMQHGSLTAEVVAEKAEPTVTPEPTVAPASAALNPEKLYALVDAYRQGLGYAPLQHDARLKDIAIARAPELFDEIFVNGNMHAGFNTRAEALPYFATENIIYYNNEDGALNWWLNSPVHRATIHNNTYTHAEIACEGNSCVMVYSGFQPKQ